jgi:fatty acid desaturase
MATVALHRLAARRVAVPKRGEERPLWQLVAILYAVIALIVVGVIALAFLGAWLATGSAT